MKLHDCLMRGMAFHTGGADCEALEGNKDVGGVMDVDELKGVAGVRSYR